MLQSSSPISHTKRLEGNNHCNKTFSKTLLFYLLFIISPSLIFSLSSCHQCAKCESVSCECSLSVRKGAQVWHTGNSFHSSSIKDRCTKIKQVKIDCDSFCSMCTGMSLHEVRGNLVIKVKVMWGQVWCSIIGICALHLTQTNREHTPRAMSSHYCGTQGDRSLAQGSYLRRGIEGVGEHWSFTPPSHNPCWY